MINRLLIANRGEIAVRIIKTCRDMGITSIAIYSDADKHSLHVRLADEAYLLGDSPSSESYLNISKIISLAMKVKADAIHPGYGFLSENEKFIRAVEAAGMIFIGPSADSAEMMGNKANARRLMEKYNVPIVPGTVNPVTSIEEGKMAALSIGYPVLLKASEGGGGKGMRKVLDEKEFEDSFSAAAGESLKAFGSSDIYIEKYIENPKHIEVQIIADKYGNYVHLFERDCSIQRRHQKVIEEAPSIFVDDDLRKVITNAAINAAKACAYYNAGTIEFLVDKNKHFYFLEMNTRLQVEHPVTEMITGIDLVQEQIRIAEGKELSFTQEDIKISGHAIECRIYAEDADNNFVPSTGQIKYHRLPGGIGVRVDTGIDLLSNVSVYYDPLLSKVISWGKTREEAVKRMDRALSEYKIAGVLNNITSCKWIISREKYLDSSFDINFLENYFLPITPDKWKNDIDKKYLEAASVIAAVIKNKKSELSTSFIDCSKNNKWKENKYE